MGNVGSGFGNKLSRCGFEDGYFPVHAPLGFPNCANYKGSPEQRIADLTKRGYGTDIINAWKKYYEENPDDPLKIEYNVYDPSISYSMSKAAALAEKKKLDDFESWFNSQFRKSGLTWSQRVSMQSAAQSKRIAQNINNRTIVIDSILSDTTNIQRWENEAFAIKQAEERLRQIQLENQRIEEQRIENKRLQEIENKRLQEIENQIPIIQPEIIPAVVASSSLIPLAVIGLLLYTSKGKK
jgi:hypothetical protein